VPEKPEVIFACDVNLGFPDRDPEWAAFFQKNGWRVENYEALDELTERLKTHAAAAAFLPAANYYYFKDDPFYTGLAMGLAAKTGKPFVNSVLVVPQASPAQSVLDLKGKRLGDINSYCTTSYFSPAILLSQHNLPFKSFFSTVQPVGAWQHQIDAVRAGRADATMVEEGTWQERADNRSATRVIGRLEGLPGPLIVVGKTVDDKFRSEFLARLCAIRTSAPNQPFTGFTSYRPDVVADFFKKVDHASAIETF
jgi:phosphonate transport system substrate-binding protein